MKQHAIFELAKTELASVEQELASIIRSRVDLVSDIGGHLLRAGGKRLRPALYILCAKCGSQVPAGLVPVAAAIELIHMATLVHDDVIDSAATRRGLATANARWGNHVTVLAGDYLFAKAFSLIAVHGGARALQILTETICSICEGEISQARDLFNPRQSMEDYLTRIDNKTACFIAASCELGAMTAGLTTADAEALRLYGYAIGMAFQITDDLLDVTASSEQIGKPAGNDLRQGVLTLPVLYALQHSPQAGELRRIIEARDMTDANVQKGIAVVHTTDAVEYCYGRVSDYLTTARRALPASLPAEVYKSLWDIADFVGLRKY
ncbi:polyprenyl synthetase family protein [Anaeroselena agilis]|uniref:Polyprenyl synthetase family protein n=1 Tax=Anaeroselena agilis TaxID=3063788 RepID=A0ABU3NZW8_9FIRM|nr:polyprenyl synthetase family protein [Selenomonadales bacterium 4137-cl]